MKRILLLYLFVIMERVFFRKLKSGRWRVSLKTKDAFDRKVDDLHGDHAILECASEKDDEHASKR